MNAPRDNNRAPVLMVTLNTDPTQIFPVQVNSDHYLMCSDGTDGSGSDTENAQRDENRVVAFWGVSSVDGVTPVAVWGNAEGRILINSN